MTEPRPGGESSNLGGSSSRPGERERQVPGAHYGRSDSGSLSGARPPALSTDDRQRELLRAVQERKGAEKRAAKEMGVSLARYKEMQEVFKLFDADGSGSIDPKEIRTQMSSLGFEVDNTTIYQLISDLDSDGSQQIEFEEFAGLLKNELRLYHPDATTRHSCGEIYDFMDDLDPEQRDAKIDASNLRRVADVLGDNITDAELQAMIAGADRDGKGYVSCEDFYELMVSVSKTMGGEEGDYGDSEGSETVDGSEVQ